MTSSFRRAVAALVLACATPMLSGCFGSFTLVRKVHAFNESFGSKVVQTLVFWVFCILPVYEFAALGDAVVLNLIEFWTGSNPLSMAEGESMERVVQTEHGDVHLTFLEQGRRVVIDGPTGRFELEVADDGAVLRDEAGQVVSESRMTAEGGLVAHTARGTTVTRDAAAVSRIAEAMESRSSVALSSL